jgi:hypothetical protein
MAQALRTAPLSKIRYALPQGVDYYLFGFPDEAERLYMQVDFGRLAAELPESSPRMWVTLVRLAHDARMHGLPFAEQLIEKADFRRFIAHVDGVAADYAYELRTLLWFLSFGSGTRAAGLAADLRRVVRAAALGSPAARADLLEAYAALDGGQAAALAQELAVAVPAPEKDTANNEELAEIDRPRQRCVDRFRELDGRGEDYDIDAELQRLGAEEAWMLML